MSDMSNTRVEITPEYETGLTKSAVEQIMRDNFPDESYESVEIEVEQE